MSSGDGSLAFISNIPTLPSPLFMMGAPTHTHAKQRASERASERARSPRNSHTRLNRHDLVFLIWQREKWEQQQQQQQQQNRQEQGNYKSESTVAFTQLWIENGRSSLCVIAAAAPPAQCLFQKYSKFLLLNGGPAPSIKSLGPCPLPTNTEPLQCMPQTDTLDSAVSTKINSLKTQKNSFPLHTHKQRWEND